MSIKSKDQLISLLRQTRCLYEEKRLIQDKINELEVETAEVECRYFAELDLLGKKSSKDLKDQLDNLNKVIEEMNQERVKKVA